VIAVDASVLAYAVNRYAPEHARASAVVETLAEGDRPWALPWPALHAFLAYVTHPHAVVRPLRPSDAWAFVASLLASGSVRALGPTERHATVVGETLDALPPGSDPGAFDPRGIEIAAVLREHGVRELLSTDRALRRFAFLSVTDPLHGEPWSPGAPPARRYRTLRPRTR
jgi:predicted nucleic acid-binding protein